MSVIRNLKSGDLFEFYYVRNNDSVIHNERIFSTAICKWIYIDKTSIVISKTNSYYDDYLNFINSRGQICKIWYNDASPESGLSTVGPISIRKISV